MPFELHLIGDVLLLFKKHKKLVFIGSISFGIGHILYNIELIRYLYHSTPYGLVYLHFLWLLLIYLIFFALIFTYIVFKQKRRIAFASYTASYFVALGALVPVSIIISIYNIYGLFLLFGFIVFLISDSVLFISDNLGRHYKYRNIVVSTTYVTAELLVILGLLLI